jgi:hypothetical protein
VQLIELAERNSAGTHFLHRWLVLCPPVIGKSQPVEPDPLRRKLALGFALNRSAPVDEGAEDIED